MDTLIVMMVTLLGMGAAVCVSGLVINRLLNLIQNGLLHLLPQREEIILPMAQPLVYTTRLVHRNRRVPHRPYPTAQSSHYAQKDLPVTAGVTQSVAVPTIH